MSNLKIYNTLAREKQTFIPMEAGKVRMYVCGMTIYDYCHIGHARMMMAFDVVYRWLKVSGYDVNYVRNITDIDDKIIRRAVENGETISQLTTRFDKPGTYAMPCHEFCGIGHHAMWGSIHVVPLSAWPAASGTAPVACPKS